MNHSLCRRGCSIQVVFSERLQLNALGVWREETPSLPRVSRAGGSLC